jgi:hypothetical protein
MRIPGVYAYYILSKIRRFRKLRVSELADVTWPTVYFLLILLHPQKIWKSAKSFETVQMSTKFLKNSHELKLLNGRQPEHVNNGKTRMMTFVTEKQVNWWFSV